MYKERSARRYRYLSAPEFLFTLPGSSTVHQLSGVNIESSRSNHSQYHGRLPVRVSECSRSLRRCTHIRLQGPCCVKTDEQQRYSVTTSTWRLNAEAHLIPNERDSRRKCVCSSVSGRSKGRGRKRRGKRETQQNTKNRNREGDRKTEETGIKVLTG